MRESRSSGSVEGAVSDHGPYSDLSAHEFNCHVGTPGRLRVLRVDWHTPCAAMQVFRRRRPLDSLLAQPDAPHIMARPGIADIVAPLEDTVAIVDAVLEPSSKGGREMKLSRKSASISLVGENARHQSFIRANPLPKRPQPCCVWIASCEKARSRRGADRILHIGMCQRHRLGHQLPQVRRVDDVIVQTLDRVESLHVRTDPENIGHPAAVQLDRNFRPNVDSGLRYLQGLLCVGWVRCESTRSKQGGLE